MDDPFQRPTLTSSVYYKDPSAALDWLEKVFGFERIMVITDKDGNLAHSEMRFGDGLIMVGSEWADYVGEPEERRRQEHPDSPCASERRISTAIAQRARPPAQKSCRAGRAVLRRPHLSRARSRRPYVDLRPDRARGQPRRGGKGERPQDRRLDLTAGLDRTLAALADPHRRRVVELLRERPWRAGELARALRAQSLGAQPPSAHAEDGRPDRGEPS